MPDNEVKVRITADASGAVSGFNQTTAAMKKMEGDSSGVISSLKSGWIGYSAIVAGAAITMRQAWDSAKIGAEYEEQTNILNNLSRKYNQTAASIVSDMEHASEGMVAKAELMSVALGGIAKGLKPEQLTNLADAAKILSDVSGGSATDALARMAEAIETGRLRGLESLGGTIDLAESFGELEGRLTKAEKAQAAYALIMEKATKLQREQTDAIESSADKMEKIEAKWKNITHSVSTFLKTIVIGAVDAFDQAGQDYAQSLGIDVHSLDQSKAQPLSQFAIQKGESPNKILDDIRKKAEDRGKKDTGISSGQFESIEKSYKDMISTLSEKVQAAGLDDLDQQLNHVSFSFDKLLMQVEEYQKKGLSKSKANYLKDLSGLAKEVETNDIYTKLEKSGASSYEALINRIVQDDQKNKRTQFEFYQDFDPSGQKAHEARMQQLAEYAEAFREAGVAEVDVRKWVYDQTLKYETDLQAQKLENITDGLGASADAFESLSRIYDEDSKERKRLHDVAIAFSIAEKASLAGESVLAAVKAIANQGSGEPYTAFARVAAMAAAMASLLATAGIAFNGGGSSSSTASTPAMGNSSVFGAEYGTASESLSQSMQLLQDTYDLEDVKLTKIYDELKDLNSNITGLVTTYIRTGGNPTAEDFSVSLGYDYGDAQNAWRNFDEWTKAGFLRGTPYGDNMARFAELDVVGSWVNKEIGQIIGDLFGGGQERWSTGSGIALGKTKLSDIIGGGSAGARGYIDIAQRTSTEFWRDDSYDYWTEYKALDSDVSRMFDLVYSNLSSTLLELANQFGINASDVLNYAFEEAKINLKDMTGEEMNDALQEYISKIGDEATESLFGDIIGWYQQLNEGLLETATRLVIDKNSVLSILEYTNQSFDGTTSELIKFSESLISVAGNLEKLTDAFNTYYDAFFSDSEKQADREESLSAALSTYGYNLPTKRQGYRDLIEEAGLLTTPEGITQYYALLALAETADKYYDYIEKSKANINPSDYATRLDYLRALSAPKYAAGGYHTGGWRIVGEETPELEYTGPSVIYNRRQAQNLISMDGVINELRQLRQDMSAQSYALAKTQSDILRLHKRWDGDGMPAERTLQ